MSFNKKESSLKALLYWRPILYPISNLWMTLYYLDAGEEQKAKETFDFVVKTVGKHYFIGEQVDNNTLKPNWVIGLGWSHAMFIIVLERLYGNK